jgi:predicted Zn-ribbon and HTH transcriptional regulator
MVIEINPRTVDILDQATREHYRLMACSLCGGHELHAKTKPATKCLRCGHYRTLERITPLVTRQRCRRCQETFWAVLKTTTCVKCRGTWTQEPKVDLQPVSVVRR